VTPPRAERGEDARALRDATEDDSPSVIDIHPIDPKGLENA